MMNIYFIITQVEAFPPLPGSPLPLPAESVLLPLGLHPPDGALHRVTRLLGLLLLHPTHETPPHTALVKCSVVGISEAPAVLLLLVLEALLQRLHL